MHSIIKYFFATTLLLVTTITYSKAQDLFPDGIPIPEWFKENKRVDIDRLGKKYLIKIGRAHV